MFASMVYQALRLFLWSSLLFSAFLPVLQNRGWVPVLRKTVLAVMHLGRKNLPPVLRRCSLSCQGCHVNPNGGGLRSFYGKWNEDYWLRSFRSKKLKQPKMAAPLHKQFYGRNPKNKVIVKNIKKIIRQSFHWSGLRMSLKTNSSTIAITIAITM